MLFQFKSKSNLDTADNKNNIFYFFFQVLHYLYTLSLIKCLSLDQSSDMTEKPSDYKSYSGVIYICVR